MAKKQGRKKGFTLVETILTILIVGIIAGVSAKILLSGLDTYSFVVNRSNVAQHARVAMERMVSELTEVEWTDILYMSNSWLSYVDRDGLNSSFKSGTNAGQPALIRGNDYLAGPLGFIDFDYLQANGSTAFFSSQVRKINIELSLDAAGGYGAITLRTEVFPRNLMYDEFE